MYPEIILNEFSSAIHLLQNSLFGVENGLKLANICNNVAEI